MTFSFSFIFSFFPFSLIFLFLKKEPRLEYAVQLQQSDNVT